MADQNPSIIINGKMLSLISFLCYYCLDIECCPIRHSGYFVCIPTLYASEWQWQIEKAINQSLHEEKFYFDVKFYNARIAVVHLFLSANGEYDRKSPKIREGTFLWGPEYTCFTFAQSQQVCLSECSKKLRMTQKRAAIELELSQLNDKIDSMKFIHISEEERFEPKERTELPEEMKLHCDNAVSFSSELFPNEVREKARDLYANGMSYRKIENMLQKEFPNRSPKKSTIALFVQEGGFIAKACAAMYIYEHRFEITLGSDESSSRHRSILIVNAMGKQTNNGYHESKVLGIVQLSGKDGKTIANEILSLLQTLSDLACKLEGVRTASFSSSISSFIAYSSDHVGVNKKVFDLLNEEKKKVSTDNTISLKWIRCVMHKYNLMEDHLVAHLKKCRTPFFFLNNCGIDEEVSGVDTIMLEDVGGMKSSLGTNIHSATDFLYKLSKIMTATAKGEKANWGHQFNFELKEKGVEWKVKSMVSGCLHVYSHLAL